MPPDNVFDSLATDNAASTGVLDVFGAPSGSTLVNTGYDYLLSAIGFDNPYEILGLPRNTTMSTGEIWDHYHSSDFRSQSHRHTPEQIEAAFTLITQHRVPLDDFLAGVDFFRQPASELQREEMLAPTRFDALLEKINGQDPYKVLGVTPEQWRDPGLRKDYLDLAKEGHLDGNAQKQAALELLTTHRLETNRYISNTDNTANNVQAPAAKPAVTADRNDGPAFKPLDVVKDSPEHARPTNTGFDYLLKTLGPNNPYDVLGVPANMSGEKIRQHIAQNPIGPEEANGQRAAALVLIEEHRTRLDEVLQSRAVAATAAYKAGRTIGGVMDAVGEAMHAVRHPIDTLANSIKEGMAEATAAETAGSKAEPSAPEPHGKAYKAGLAVNGVIKPAVDAAKSGLGAATGTMWEVANALADTLVNAEEAANAQEVAAKKRTKAIASSRAYDTRPNAYEVMGLQEGASLEQIYRQKARIEMEYAAFEKPTARQTALYERAQTAFELIKSPERQAAYDDLLTARRMEMSRAPDAFKVLGVEPTATQAEIKNRIEELHREFEAKKNPTVEERVAYENQKIAYEAIDTPERQKRYGAELSKSKEIAMGPPEPAAKEKLTLKGIGEKITATADKIGRKIGLDGGEEANINPVLAELQNQRPTAYEAMNLKSTATQAEIYSRMAEFEKEYAALDRVTPEHEYIMKRARQAFAAINAPEKQQRYDQSVAEAEARGAGKAEPSEPLATKQSTASTETQTVAAKIAMPSDASQSIGQELHSNSHVSGDSAEVMAAMRANGALPGAPPPAKTPSPLNHSADTIEAMAAMREHSVVTTTASAPHPQETHAPKSPAQANESAHAMKGIGAAGLAARANALKDGNMSTEERAVNATAIALDTVDLFSKSKLGQKAGIAGNVLGVVADTIRGAKEDGIEGAAREGTGGLINTGTSLAVFLDKGVNLVGKGASVGGIAGFAGKGGLISSFSTAVKENIAYVTGKKERTMDNAMASTVNTIADLDPLKAVTGLIGGATKLVGVDTGIQNITISSIIDRGLGVVGLTEGKGEQIGDVISELQKLQEVKAPLDTGKTKDVLNRQREKNGQAVANTGELIDASIKPSMKEYKHLTSVRSEVAKHLPDGKIDGYDIKTEFDKIDFTKKENYAAYKVAMGAAVIDQQKIIEENSSFWQRLNSDSISKKGNAEDQLLYLAAAEKDFAMFKGDVDKHNAYNMQMAQAKAKDLAKTMQAQGCGSGQEANAVIAQANIGQGKGQTDKSVG